MFPAQSPVAWAVMVGLGGVLGSGAVATALGWLAQGAMALVAG